jgi:integrase
MTSTRAARLATLGIKKDPGGLTQDIIRKALSVPVSERYVLSDGGDQGLFLQVQPAGVGPKGRPAAGLAALYCQGRVHGRLVHVKLGNATELELDEARDLAIDARRLMRKGINPNEQKRAARAEAEKKVADERARVSVRKYVTGDYWQKHLRNKKSGHAEQDRLLAAWGDVLDQRLDELTADAINDALQARRDAGLAAGTVLRDWTSFRAMLGKARAAGLVAALPLRPQALQGLQGKKRIRWLGQDDPKELERFEKALLEESAEVRAILLLEALAGFRRGELIGKVDGKKKDKTLRQLPGLRRSEVNLREGVATIPPERSKSGKERRVRLNAKAVELLKGLTVIGTDGVYFPGRVHGWRQRLKKAMARIRKAVGSDDFRAHDLRHHFAVRARQAGAPLEVVRDLLGHASTKTTEIYAHVGLDELKEAVAKIGL